MTPPRPPITCHVLDTTTGRPGASIPVTLTLLSISDAENAAGASQRFAGLTNGDGRVTSWSTGSGSAPLDELFRLQSERGEASKWSLNFAVGDYWRERGVEAFFEEVEVRFTVRGGSAKEHFHVPVLVGPFSYTTYRGS
ncbi:hydroxyisourate hydrolase [Coniosporium apollinis CBS 100218]|uniref:5-hydroxyisourate hydrolase n=1 Tax=Coniosporium apollinis (strain CBS 100218) TaxID=1168221 RepID=R7YMT4_CONA1|nr:hydroxyisourate hydrolase [Coniosporium apollinis CBS 100218]EON63245.1 hydroxyisourate hydrolase [Coniosporium apollinis CBS 100218]